MSRPANQQLCDLAEDVEIDGDQAFTERRYEAPVGKFGKADRFDSGFNSISPNQSLESRSPNPSLDSRSLKLSVQCSDDRDEVVDSKSGQKQEDSISELQSKLSNVNIDDDEGILSCNFVELSDIEVDLFEQDFDGDTLIHMAILSGTIALAAALIDIAEDPECLNLQNDLFQTPLHLAIITESWDTAVQLVQKGCNVELCDKQGNSPLHLACRKGERDVIRAILDTFGSDERARKKYFTMKNCEGLTCLHVAAEHKHFIIMGYLFAKGADVNMGDAKSGRTILHYAAERKDVETVALLLTHPEINVDCKTFKGETPLVLAFWRNYQDIVKKLRNKGAFFSYDMFEESDDDTS